VKSRHTFNLREREPAHKGDSVNSGFAHNVENE
jgi:hypothetical protein